MEASCSGMMRRCLVPHHPALSFLHPFPPLVAAAPAFFCSPTPPCFLLWLVTLLNSPSHAGPCAGVAHKPGYSKANIQGMELCWLNFAGHLMMVCHPEISAALSRCCHPSLHGVALKMLVQVPASLPLLVMEKASDENLIAPLVSVTSPNKGKDSDLPHILGPNASCLSPHPTSPSLRNRDHIISYSFFSYHFIFFSYHFRH